MLRSSTDHHSRIPMTRFLLAACALLSITTTAFAADGHHHSEDIPLGTKQMGVWQVTANRIGEWTPGKDGAGAVDLVPAKPAAKSVRVWIGDENGQEAVKSKGEAESDHPGGWHVHVAVPKTIAAQDQFWVVIEAEDGTKSKASFPLTAEPAK
jgi:hypothetical protein